MAVPEDLETGAAAPSAAAQEPSLETATTTTAASEGNGENQCVEGEARQEPGKTLEPTTRFSGRQIFYIFGLDGVGAMILSGGVNFAIAYAMYTTQNTVKRPVRLWQLPNTLAGDAAVTIFVQCLITWFVELFLLRYDLRHHSVQPIGFISQPSHPWLRLFFFLPRDPSAGVGNPHRPWTLLEVIQQALRGLSFGVVGFLVLWPIFMGALTGFGTKEGADYVYHDKWLPQVFKLILGGVLGLLTTPLMAMFWLVKAGWEYKKQETPTVAEV
ncbi:uncharacterized protein C594.02c [Trichoderma asperellum]|uniref:Uncharacterized protein C594.02c n=1 Tax=Trichoderma asperellum TaxID=101201 RepID=A0A6V8QXM5_TRIAP|nr:hypothetical protein LI328DRAFT_20548 [Trichoderma asperelloides]GFP57120.1 uncharacterized protein C594.02c [Trichoderma asperellum]